MAVLPALAGTALFTAGASVLDLGGCSGSLPVTIAATEETVELLRDATSHLEESGAEADGECVDYQLSSASPDEVAKSLDAHDADSPDLWVPDSSDWVERVDGFEGEPKVVAPSLGQSPVVVAGRGLRQPRSWREVLARDDVKFVDPVRSSAPSAALLALTAESGPAKVSYVQVDSVMGPLAQRLGIGSDAPRDLRELARRPGGAAILSEQQLLGLQAKGVARDLDARVPKTGTLVLDYPLVAVTDEAAVGEAAEQLAGYLENPEGAELLAAAGFRSADLESLPQGQGVGELRVLPTPEAGVAAEILRRWSLLTVPSRILGVFDVSGSMDELAGRRTRVSLAAQASAEGLRMFPDQAKIGMWAFSHGLGGRDRDHRELVKIRRLDARAGGRDQRQLLGRALKELPKLTNGGTGLYDTTLAAVRAVRHDYDKKAVNTVVILTDGRNEDPGSISLTKLLQTLWQEMDPDRPVSIIAIGIGPDADAKALERIVSATSGRSYLARDAKDIGKVFKQALLSR